MATSGMNTTSISSPLGSIDLGGAEILDWSKKGRFAAVTGGDDQLRIISYNDSFKTARELRRDALPGEAQAVAIHGNRIAVAVSDDKMEQGLVQIFRWKPAQQALKLTDSVSVGFSSRQYCLER